MGAWSLSRRAIGGLLASVSILSSRPGLHFLVTASDLLDVALASFLLYQLSVGGAVVGLHVAWVFIGYLVYAYTPELYLGRYGQIVEARGFRAITAGVTVYVGVVFSRALETVPDAGAFALVPDGSGGQMAVLIVGAIASVFVFSGYILMGRGERLYSEDSAHFEVGEWFTVDSQRGRRRQIETLPRPARTLYITVEELTLGVLYLAPCVVLGIALAAINAFYPIPEALVVVGLVASYTPGSSRLAAHLGSDIEFRIADETTDVVQNLKGLLLAFLCVMSLGICGMVFVAGLTTLTFLFTVGDFLTHAGDILLAADLVAPASLPLLDVTVVLVYLWFVIGLAIIFPIYGLYGLVYWFLQLKRLPSYVPFWQSYWRGDASTPPRVAVRRPPGLFLPGNALIVLAAGLIWLAPEAEPSLAVIIGYDLAWPIVIAIVAWSVYATFRGEPQSLAHEGRDVTVAFLLQLITGLVLGMSTGSLPFGNLTVAILFFVLGFGGLAYFPEVSLYADRQEGAAAFHDVLYVGILFAILMTIIATLWAVPPAVFVVVVVLWAIWLLATYLENRMTTPED